ncbi:MAG: hypothetical protein M1812_007128 [Candelaria pacifica]|nr:MAG: hypothetical protein M1812_007128 [Candelaria pacifica]
MSAYGDDPPRRHKSHRERRSRRDPMSDYSESTYVDPRDAPPVRTIREQALVRRTRDDSPIEEVRRDFPPRGEYVSRTTGRGPYPPRARSLDRQRRDRDYYGGGGGGGRRGHRDDRRRSRYDSSSDSESDYRPQHGGRRKSLGEQALAALGIGGAAGPAASNGRSRNRSRSRRGGRRSSYSSDSYSSRSRSRGGGGTFGNEKIQQAVQAALTAGAVEAFRSRGEPGPWTGEKGKRILTAAVGAAGVDGLADKDPEHKSKRHLAEAVIGGLAANRVVNGARDRSRSRSRGGRGGGGGGGGDGGLGGLAAGGLAAAAGKALLDRTRSKSRNRGRRYSSSDSSRSRSRRPQRSKSVSDYVNKGLAAVGLADNDKRRDDYDRGGRSRGGGGDYRDSQVARPRGAAGGEAKGSSSSSDTEISTSEEEKRVMKLRGKEYLTTGLAGVATIHAVHGVYQSMEKRDKRHKQVVEGKLSPEEASKMKKQAIVKDAASIGIAVLGIKSAMGEWKEVQEQRHECHEFTSQKEQRARHREELRKKRQARLANGGSSGGGNGYYNNGPVYHDGNPYAGY